MAALSEKRIAELLVPYLQDFPRESTDAGGGEMTIPSELVPKLSVYLDLLLSWNARTNLTAIRSPEEIVRRHFGESLFVGCLLRRRLENGAQVLDFGSGAGFPGMPVQLLLPHIRVPLAESQGKKAAFLREVGRRLGVAVAVWAGRVEDLPAESVFDAVMLRAVDHTSRMLPVAASRIKAGGMLVQMYTPEVDSGEVGLAMPGLTSGEVFISHPGSND